MPETPPSTGVGSVSIDYFNAILHALLPSLNPSETPPNQLSTRQLDYLHAIWQAEIVQAATLANKVDRWENWDADLTVLGNETVQGDLQIGGNFYFPLGLIHGNGTAVFAGGNLSVSPNGRIQSNDWYIDPMAIIIYWVAAVQV